MGVNYLYVGYHDECLFPSVAISLFCHQNGGNAWSLWSAHQQTDPRQSPCPLCTSATVYSLMCSSSMFMSHKQRTLVKALAVTTVCADNRPVALPLACSIQTLPFLPFWLFCCCFFALLKLVIMSRPDHREPLVLYGVVGQGVTRGCSSRCISMFGFEYGSQIEAADYRCL